MIQIAVQFDKTRHGSFLLLIVALGLFADVPLLLTLPLFGIYVYFFIPRVDPYNAALRAKVHALERQLHKDKRGLERLRSAKTKYRDAVQKGVELNEKTQDAIKRLMDAQKAWQASAAEAGQKLKWVCESDGGSDGESSSDESDIQPPPTSSPQPPSLALMFTRDPTAPLPHGTQAPQQQAIVQALWQATCTNLQTASRHNAALGLKNTQTNTHTNTQTNAIAQDKNTYQRALMLDLMRANLLLQRLDSTGPGMAGLREAWDVQLHGRCIHLAGEEDRTARYSSSFDDSISSHIAGVSRFSTALGHGKVTWTLRADNARGLRYIGVISAAVPGSDIDGLSYRRFRQDGEESNFAFSCFSKDEHRHKINGMKVLLTQRPFDLPFEPFGDNAREARTFILTLDLRNDTLSLSVVGHPDCDITLANIGASGKEMRMLCEMPFCCKNDGLHIVDCVSTA